MDKLKLQQTANRHTAKMANRKTPTAKMTKLTH